MVTDISFFSAEELKAELKKRNAGEKAKRERERAEKHVCRNCVHLKEYRNGEGCMPYYKCGARVFHHSRLGEVHYAVKPCHTCDLFHKKQ